MGSAETVRPTAAELKTANLKARFAAHIREWWPRETSEFKAKDYYFHIEDGPFELWPCVLSNREVQPSSGIVSPPAGEASGSEAKTRSDVTLWLLWDKKEVTSYDDEGDAYIDVINGQKARRLDSKLRYYTSPLTISAVLALILFLLIAAMEMLRSALVGVYRGSCVLFRQGKRSEVSRLDGR
jgi:hypothetical protein